MIDLLALVVTGLAGLYLLGLGVAALAVPARARAFLLGFVGSPGLHYLELLLRLAVGAALIWCAPQLRWPAALAGLGWLLVATTGGLALVPWQWHRRFAQRSVPQALRYLPLLGVASALMGAAVLFALFAGA